MYCVKAAVGGSGKGALRWVSCCRIHQFGVWLCELCADACRCRVCCGLTAQHDCHAVRRYGAMLPGYLPALSCVLQNLTTMLVGLAYNIIFSYAKSDAWHCRTRSCTNSQQPAPSLNKRWEGKAGQASVGYTGQQYHRSSTVQPPISLRHS